jgi:S1-C subfamily serine protease
LQRSVAAEKQAQQNRFLEEEIGRLKRENEEIHRLRGQFQELQQLKADRENLQRQIAQLQSSQQTLASSLRAAQQSPPPPISWIGVAMNARSAGGVEVQSVVPGGPAANSGLDTGDVITAVDGRAVANPQALRDIVAGKAVGQDVLLDVLREGSTFRLSLKTGAFPR